jgi:hypothetical protein
MVAVALAASSFSERGWELLDRVDYRLARSEDEKEAIYRLRYDAYLREGAIGPNFTKALSDRFDDTENSWTFGLYVDEKLAASIRVHVASSQHPSSPAVDAFPEFLGPEIAQGKIIVDPNRFVADAELSRLYPSLCYLTVRLGYVACAHFNADIGVATARKEHQAFYRRVLRLSPVCEPRPYPTLIKPLGLMTTHYPSVKDSILQSYPFFRSTFFERRKLFERPADFNVMPLAPEPANVNQTLAATY